MSSADEVVARSVFSPVLGLFRWNGPDGLAVVLDPLKYRPMRATGGVSGVHLVLDDGQVLGVYKWGRGRGVSKDVGAFELSDETGLGVVPRTRRWTGRYGKGVLQDHVPARAGLTVVRKGERTQRMAAFDYAVAQGDRPAVDENFLVREDGALMSHDNGTSFVRPAPGKTEFIQSNFVVAHLNEPLHPRLLDRLRSTDLGRLTDRLYGAELDAPEVEGTIARVTEMREEGRITGRAWDGLILDSGYAVKHPGEAPSIAEWIRSTDRDGG
ncbi:hypothetical protein [Actinoallomurus acaciae]|uniref:Uncharacterized protein n=1 Tax=Actinoallomurus acaciae TaxID=502577 RepID=A0ABV5YHL8_9ACTN